MSEKHHATPLARHDFQPSMTQLEHWQASLRRCVHVEFLEPAHVELQLVYLITTNTYRMPRPPEPRSLQES